MSLECTHFFECDCLTCQDAISKNIPPVSRRIVGIVEYGTFKKVTVPINARKRGQWLENPSCDKCGSYE